ncbi:cytochrome c biogenesis protein CcmG, thiol:disulfide interchange protein DsbE [Salinihabitans flavidus]|uniref:Cytochrome c biogenesis protein CcmG, thiol:disulfide interchange protein DsbE n=1 Tax=Salinihabitans flavidus TaxID=569882 RepID=A0A1H8RNX1_9RHOB|nr:DsbE family thiol:disulfide interchange protein [Salinihabitans flavidus]SEO67987.1 cytochrome c biogenesis protein CcmG, thiol:disulfide interchange protein DsbE [Salinihabitans flavidus]
MKRINPLMILPPAIFLLLAALFFFGMKRDNPDELPSALTGREVPAVQVTALGDKPMFDDAALRDGRVKLLNFWASWCAPCRVEHPNLDALAREGLPIYGVNYKDKPGNALGFLAELGDPYTAVGADTAGRMALDWGVYGVPETYLIDARGRIVLRIAGPVTEREIENRLRPALDTLGWQADQSLSN